MDKGLSPEQLKPKMTELKLCTPLNSASWSPTKVGHLVQGGETHLRGGPVGRVQGGAELQLGHLRLQLLGGQPLVHQQVQVPLLAGWVQSLF